jgi:protein ImuB
MAAHVLAGEASPLWLAVYLPDLPLEGLVGEAAGAGPVAVVEDPGARRRVLVCNAEARAGGVHPGMSLVAAWALLPALRPVERDRGAEARALARVAAWAGQFTPAVSLLPDQGLVLEVGGSLALFGGPDALWERVRQGLSDLGLRAALAAAPTALGAWWLARAGGRVRVRDQQALADRLGRLPLACADLPADQRVRLAGMGVLTLGDLMRLPRDGLARRLGGEVVESLDRALGRAPDPRRPYVPPRAFRGRLVLPAGVTEAGALRFPLHRLVLELVGHLRAVGGGVERVTVTLEHPRAPATRLTVGLAGPSRDGRHLQALLGERLARVALPAPVEGVALEAGRIVDLAAASLDLFAGADPWREDWRELVDRLRARLGEAVVQGLATVADHRPERAWRRAPAGAADPGGEIGPRPLWLLDPPSPLATRDAHPCWGGPLTLRAGPERIEGGWWDGEDVARDYYVAENPAGERCWVFQERRSGRRWFLQGIFS